jgi:release factor glutamine methyltransferase
VTSDPAVAVPTVRDLLVSVTRAVRSGVEARWIVASALGLPSAELTARLDDDTPATVVAAVHAIVDRCRAGEPLQYALGTWAFRTLELSVDRRVLIPRPETEHLVDVALGELAHQATMEPGGLVAVDLGTGSGAIALSMAAEWPAHGTSELSVWATDVSADALEVFGHNLASLMAARPDTARSVHQAHGPWLDALPHELAGRLHLVASNPPYVSEAEWERLDAAVRDHEPRRALVAGPTGLEALEEILRSARAWLVPGGSVVLEIAPAQAHPIADAAAEMGYVDVLVRPDLARRPRVMVGRWPGTATP